MTLDRALIKSQAKEILKGNVLKLFIISFVVAILINGFAITANISDNIKSYKYFKENPDIISSFPLTTGEYTPEELEKSMTEWSQRVEQEAEKIETERTFLDIPAVKSFFRILQFIMMPLSIALCAIYLKLVNGENKQLGEGLSYVFKFTFDKFYFSKLLMLFLRTLFTVLWALLFIFPGVIYYYKVYFASYIMAEKPEIGWNEALNLSKKMTNGHKGELFVLDLSFIGWYLLCGITCGLAGIYVIPYVSATQALYYENFKQRAFFEGAVSAMDFMSDMERAQFNQNTYFTPPATTSGDTNDFINNSVNSNTDDTLPPYYYNSDNK